MAEIFSFGNYRDVRNKSTDAFDNTCDLSMIRSMERSADRQIRMRQELIWGRSISDYPLVVAL